jgi:hypothetical protein
MRRLQPVKEDSFNFFFSIKLPVICPKVHVLQSFKAQSRLQSVLCFDQLPLFPPIFHRGQPAAKDSPAYLRHTTPAQTLSISIYHERWTAGLNPSTVI